MQHCCFLCIINQTIIIIYQGIAFLDLGCNLYHNVNEYHIACIRHRKLRIRMLMHSGEYKILIIFRKEYSVRN